MWMIGELTDRVAAALAGNFAGVANGRVRDVPDLRAIRYYTTIGILDRPVELRGRTAFYARRHLYQLVAIKRLQAQGLRLAQIQQRLLNLADRELQKLADVKADFDSVPVARSVKQPIEKGDSPSRQDRYCSGESLVGKGQSPFSTGSNDDQPPPQTQKLEPSARRLDFWKSSPATPPAPAADDETRLARRPDVMTLVPLAEGLSVGFEACRPVTAEDIAALQTAAEHVRQILIQRRLVQPDLEI